MRLAISVSVLSALCATLAPLRAFTADKAKPDLPVGEEILEKSSGTDTHTGTHGEETDPQGKTHSTTTPVKESSAPSGDATTQDATHESAQKPKLLEGRVEPATPSQGKGFVWFAVVFVVLAVAIFVFT